MSQEGSWKAPRRVNWTRLGDEPLSSVTKGQEGAILKRFMAIAACGFAILVTVGLCAVAIRQAFACDACQETCGDEDRVNLAPANDTVTAAASGVFQSEFCFEWEYDVEPPDYIFFEFITGDSENIDFDATTYM